jgi:serine/threonine protein kinase
VSTGLRQIIAAGKGYLSSMTGLEGTRLGDYELVERVGGGGMAEVYRAKQLTAFGREVALKVIRPGLSENEKFRERFLREAQAISRLSHPNILPLIEFGEEQETLYLVMPLVREGTLRDLIRQREGALPLEEAISLFLQLCSAVQYAHEQGIIHRDIKPQNVLLQQHTHVLLADFGIARDSAETRITGEGAGLGTVEYMAPEQAIGRADKRSDIYSLGVVLYQLLTGVVPYSGSTPLQVLLKRTNEPLPDPRTLNPSLGAQIVPVLQTALAKDPAHRFQTALALGRAVQQMQPNARSGTTSAPIWPPPASSPMPRISDAPLMPPPPPAYATPAYAGPGSAAPLQPGIPSGGVPGQPAGVVSNYGPLPAGSYPSSGGVSSFNRASGGAVQTPARPGPLPPPGPGPGQPPAGKGKKWLIAALTIGVLVVVLGGLLATGFTGHGPLAALGATATARATPRPTATATLAVPSGFKPYENPNHTFRLAYPAGWSATGYFIGSGGKFDGPGTQEIVATNSGPSSAGKAGPNADSYCIGFGGQTHAQKQVTIGGQTWIQEECDDFTGLSHSQVNTIVYKGNLYLFAFTTPKGSFTKAESQYFGTVQSTFMFLV